MLRRVHEVLEGPPESPTARAVQGAIQVLIVLNVIAVSLMTVESLREQYGQYFRWFNLFSVAVFTIEYLLRILSCTNDPRYRRPVLGRLRFVLTPYALIDLLAILPAYLPAVVNVDLRSLRAIRLLRVFRVLKLGRYSKAIHTLGRALRETAPQIAVCLVGVFVLIVLASTVLYYAERDAQPEGFSSIPATAWWGVAALTTVGYGDLVPITPLGKIAGSVVALLGIGIFGLPAGIWASAFISQFNRNRTCPRCGEKL